MFTPSDKKFLKDTFASKDDLKNDLASMEKRMESKFASKDDLSLALKDQKEQILDAVDGKLVKQKDEIVDAVSEYIADTIVPMFERRDKHIARIVKKLGLPLLAD